LQVKRASGTLAISAGQARLTDVTIDSKEADLTVAGTADLTDGSLGARMVLSGSSKAAGARPDIFMALQGSAAAPSRTIDVSALAGWLTLRSVENQSRQLRAIEAQTPVQTPAAQTPAAQAPLPEVAPFPPISPLPVPVPVPKTEQAPALPAPIDIRPFPAPAR
jgi:hypothetical protein